MTSYEIVKKAIEFDNPPRLPHAVDSFGVSDIHIIGWNDIRIWDLTKKKTYATIPYEEFISTLQSSQDV